MSMGKRIDRRIDSIIDERMDKRIDKRTGRRKSVGLLGLSLLLLCVVCVFSCSTISRAEGIQRRVYDLAKVLTDVEADMLQKKAEELTGQCGMEVILVTADYLGGESTKEYADNFFDKIYGADADGVCFFIDMHNRSLWISTSGQMIYYLTDGRMEKMLDNAEGAAGDGDYSAVFESFIKDTSAWYKKGVPRDLYIYDEDTKTYRKYKSITAAEALIALLAALAAGGAAAAAVYGKYRLKWGTYKYPYRDKSRMTLTDREDRFLYKRVTQRVIPKNDSSSGGGSGGNNVSSTHTSSSGGTHGGAGRGF